MRRWLSSSWLEFVISALVAAVEVAMLAPWLHLLAGLGGGTGASIPAPLGMVVAGLVSFWSTRLFLTGGWDVGAARAMSLGLWLALAIVWLGVADAGLSAPIAFIDRLVGLDRGLVGLLAVAGLAWWRGLSLGAEPDPFSADFVRRMIRRGVTVLGAALVAAALVGETTAEHALRSAAVALPVVVIGGLVAASAVQVRLARSRVRAAGDRAALGWLGAALGLSVGIVLVALLVAGIAGPDIWAQVLEPIDVVASALQTAIFWVLVGIAYVIFLALTPIIWLVRAAMSERQAPEQPQQPPGPPPFPEFADRTQQALPPALVSVIEGVVVVAVAVIVGWLVLRSLRRYRGRGADQAVEEIRESVWSSDLALDQLRGWLRGLGARRGGRARGISLDLDAAPATVRDAYRYVLVLAAGQGQPRLLKESPIDYAGRLEGVWPETGAALDDLTVRYLAARYGERSSDVDVAAAREDWERIRRRLQQSNGTERSRPTEDRTP